MKELDETNCILNTYEIKNAVQNSVNTPISLSKFSITIKKWYENTVTSLYPLPNQSTIINKLTKMKVPEIKIISSRLNLPIGVKKQNLIDNIVCKQYTLKNLLYLQSTSFEINIPVSLIDTVNEIITLWSEYEEHQKKYFLNVETTLDDCVYGMNDAKRQILRLLGQWAHGENDGYVFGFEGPPGTGKTTIAKYGISKCLTDENNNSRPFIFIPLGGSSNGSTLEGHNYTYSGSTWGRIIDGIIHAKCMNPIIYIDELDKVSNTEHGKEIVGILTHLTDPSQNKEFMDKYFSGIPFNLSKCLFIFSYNDPSKVDRILLDRIQRINIKPLKKEDKVMVCRNHIIPEITKLLGYDEGDIYMERSELEYIIDTYMRSGCSKIKRKDIRTIQRSKHSKYTTM